MTSNNLCLGSLARCERPNVSLRKLLTFHPGRFAQGPEEKFGLFGFFIGLFIIIKNRHDFV
jgi:hypothetical protein